MKLRGLYYGTFSVSFHECTVNVQHFFLITVGFQQLNGYNAVKKTQNNVARTKSIIVKDNKLLQVFYPLLILSLIINHNFINPFLLYA